MMYRGTCTRLAMLAAVLALTAGAARFAHAQGDVQAFPRPGGSVLVTWLASPDPAVVGYNVYRRGSNLTTDKAVPVSQTMVAGTSLVDAGADNKGLPLGQAVSYFVRPVYADSSGKQTEGPNSVDATATPQNPLTLPPGNFVFYDINTAYPGSVTVDSNTLTIRASGGSLWDSNDAQTFLAMPVSGNFQATVQIKEHPINEDPSNGSGNSKIAIELRTGLYRGDAFATIFTSVDRNDPGPVHFEGHTASYAGYPYNYSDAGPSTDDTTYPLWLRLVLQGTKATAFVSTDGKAFDQVGGEHDFGTLPPQLYVGLAVAADKPGQYSVAKFDIPSFEIKKQ
jgi:hypothetical protein